MITWRGFRIDPNSKNPNKRYKLSTGANAVTNAVRRIKNELGWTENLSIKKKRCPNLRQEFSQIKFLVFFLCIRSFITEK